MTSVGLDVVPSVTGGLGYLVASVGLQSCQCRPPVVPVCGLDVVVSIGRPRLLVLSSKGNEQGNESRAQLVASVTGSVDVIPLLALSVAVCLGSFLGGHSIGRPPSVAVVALCVAVAVIPLAALHPWPVSASMSFPR